MIVRICSRLLVLLVFLAGNPVYSAEPMVDTPEATPV